MALEQRFNTRPERLAAIFEWEQSVSQATENEGLLLPYLSEAFWFQVWLQTLQSQEVMSESDVLTILEAQYLHNSPVLLANLKRYFTYDLTSILIDQIQGMLACEKFLTQAQELSQPLSAAWQARDQLHALVCNYLLRQPLLKPGMDGYDRADDYKVAILTYQMVLENTRQESLPAKFTFSPSNQHLEAIRVAVSLGLRALEWQQYHFSQAQVSNSQADLDQECSDWWRELGAEMNKLWK